ncbi:hypothetical protein ABZT08_03245 [Streptomyces sp. NPDC005526]|uniref:hypothetical protein n=1 Tax=Streptomyces sp. NPDC005526 TaxID=3156885 RepID=UPI0033B6B635
MSTQRPGESEMPEDRDAGPGVPDEVWRRFAEDSEQAIRRTAPREPSARERADRAWEHPPCTGAVRRPEQWRPQPAAMPEPVQEEPVGELWQPEEPGPAWRDMDSRARRRRVGRVFGAVVMIAVIVAVVRPGEASGPREDDGTTTSQSGEATDEAPGVPVGPSSPVPQSHS